MISEELNRRHRLYEPDAHFLSAFNPLLTVDQKATEAHALRLIKHPAVQQGCQVVAERWRKMVAHDMTEEAERRFAELIEEFTFAYTLLTVNGDPNYPKVVSGIYGPPHEWMGQKVPGTRASGGDGPDQSYSFIPVNFGARFEIYGQRFQPEPGDIPYMLSGDVCFNMTLAMLQSYDMVYEPDGSFVITLDPEPANGRPNHIQTLPNTRYVFIRECRNDWREVAAKHRIRRLDPPTRRPLTDDQLAGQAAHQMAEAVPKMYWFMRLFVGLEVNAITDPFHTGGVFGMVSQGISFAHLELAEDEAFVATIGHGGAGFRDIVLHDYWFRTFPYWKQFSNRNPGQSVPNADGNSTTYVISHTDPGVHNWLEPGGFHDMLVVNRWQALPKNPEPGTQAFARGKLVKLAELQSALPLEMKRVTPQERDAERQEREATFLLRYSA